MTYQTCERLAKHCKSMGDEAGAKMYERKAKERKEILKIKTEETKEKKEKK